MAARLPSGESETPAVPTRSMRVSAAGRGRHLSAITTAYPSLTTRAYCLIRFRIIKGRFLEEIGQFLPRDANVLEVGCGFGLFALYFARTRPDLSIRGFDIDEDRIKQAEHVRRRLGLVNVAFEVGDARDTKVPGGLNACYMLDIVHHIPHESAIRLLQNCYDQLEPGGVLVIKDVDTRPRYKMAFTWLLDVAMTRGERPAYWNRDELLGELRRIGFDVISYAMVDILPYPHQLFVCTKPT
jgi:SAM-dependent methyltransferase